MTSTPFHALIHDVSLLLAIALIFDMATVRPLSVPAWVQQMFSGLILGTIGIFVMLSPWVFASGIVFDTRSILLGMSGLFFGTLPTLVAMGMTAALRFYQGGEALTGVAVILATGLLGLGWRHYRQRSLSDISVREFYLFGLVSHVVMLLLMFMLPWETALKVLSHISLPVLVLYPLGTAALGVLMRNRLRRGRAEDLRRESEQRYRLLADNVSDVLWILNLASGEWEYMSPSVERLRGYTVEEVLAQPVEGMMTSGSDEEGRAKIKERTQLMLNTDNEPHAYIDEVAQHCKDGSTVWAEVSTLYTRNDKGQPSLLGVSRDITQRKQAEEALRASENNFHRLVEEAPIAIFIQTEGRFTYANQACLQLLGAETVEQLLDQVVIDRFHPDFREMIVERMRQVNEDQQEVDAIDMKILRLDGTTADVEAFGVPFVFHNKHGALSFIRDISARKQADENAFELALERERRSLLTSFVREASHEFRTPLFLIEANLYLIEKLTNAAERKQKVSEIKQQLTGITRLIEMLTESTMLDTESIGDMELLDLNTLLNQVIDDLEHQSPAHAPTLSRSLAPDLPQIMGSPHGLHTALAEIVGNALRFTPAGGRIDVCSGRHVDGLMMEVQDNGPGIPADALPHLFKRFYRQDTAHTTPGLGLGLSIAQAIIKSHGGRIEVESQVGSGSLFRVVLPLSDGSKQKDIV